MAQGSMRALVDLLPGAACVHRDGHVLHANAAFARALGYLDPGELRALPVHALVCAQDLEAFEARWRDVAAHGTPASCAAIGFLARDGAIVRLRTSAAALAFDDGAEAVIELAGEAAAARARGNTATTSGLAAVGTLAAGVAHEINNPLTYVLANLDYIREQLEVHRSRLPPAAFTELDDLAAEAKVGAERVARTVRSLRIFSRIDEDRRAPLDVLHVVDAALALATNEIRHRARVLKVYRPVPLVLADEARLTQVFFSLLINAAQAIPDGHAAEHQIEVKTWTDDGHAVVEIRDSGSGIRPEHLGRVFDPFFTTKPQGVGSGLGLAISHGTVQSLGGEIVVESTLGLGATFRVVLPGAVDARPEVATAVRISTGRGRTGKILVIDDDAAVGAAIRRALGRRHDVSTTTRAQEAIERVEAGELFDLILCDLMMPELSGMDLHAALLARVPDQASRMVFITGGAFTVAAREFLDRIPNDRFDKPFDASRLRLLAKTMVDDRPPPSRQP
jgi:two-component system, cell cycle sensor histidine kinase and response regulator CckA